MVEVPLSLHRDAVRAEWVDYNGHMNVAYYVLAFDHATDAFLDFVGLGPGYLERTGRTTFALEAHVTYQRELLGDEPFAVTTRLLDFDEKRMHYFHAMHRADGGELAATLEQVSIHVDLATRRSARMPEEALARLGEVLAAHRRLARPPEAGRVIGLRPRTTAAG